MKGTEVVPAFTEMLDLLHLFPHVSLLMHIKTR